MEHKPKSIALAGVLQIFPGLGIGRFYLGNWKIGFSQFFLAGILRLSGIGMFFLRERVELYGVFMAFQMIATICSLWCFLDGIVLLLGHKKGTEVLNKITAVVANESVHNSLNGLKSAGREFEASFEMKYNTDEKFYGNEYFEEWGTKRYVGKTYGDEWDRGKEYRDVYGNKLYFNEFGELRVRK